MITELSALTSAAATALVELMTTDAWARAKSGVERLWRQVRPERAHTLPAELDEARADLVEARRRRDSDAEAALVAEWDARFRRLVAGNAPGTAALERLANELVALGPAGSTGGVHMTATAYDNARIYQANRDQTIYE
jgi:hypothetical protein